MRGVTLLLVAAALAAVPIFTLDRGENVVMVAGPELSAERGATGLLGRIEVAADRARANGGATRLGLVGIDAGSRVIVDLATDTRDEGRARGSLVSTGANLESALALAAAMLPADVPGRIVVAFDGHATRGNAARAIPAISQRGVKVDVLPTVALAAGEVLVERVFVPDRVYAGDPFPLHATIYSHGHSNATLRIRKDGDIIVERALELIDGRSRIEATVPKATVGRARYEVSLDAPGDTFPQNNRDGVTVDVVPPPDVLIVAAQPACEGPWAARDQEQGGRTQARPVLSQGLAGLLGYRPYECPLHRSHDAPAGVDREGCS
jgi:hypothetical protein